MYQHIYVNLKPMGRDNSVNSIPMWKRIKIDDMKDMEKPELHKLCKNMNCRGYSKFKKDELIAFAMSAWTKLQSTTLQVPALSAR